MADLSKLSADYMERYAKINRDTSALLRRQADELDQDAEEYEAEIARRNELKAVKPTPAREG